jgi:hypothetical protein
VFDFATNKKIKNKLTFIFPFPYGGRGDENVFLPFFGFACIGIGIGIG